MKKILHFLLPIVILTSLDFSTNRKSAIACHSNPLPNIKVGDNILDILRDLLENGACGEKLIMMRYDVSTILICSPYDGNPGYGLKVLVRDLKVIEKRPAKFDEQSYFICDF